MSISDDEVEAAMRAFYHDADHVLRPTDSDDKDDLRRWTNDMRAALSAAAKVRAIREGDGEWVMVPREPTREMWAAMGDAVVKVGIAHHDTVSSAVYEAALNATQEGK